MSDHEDKSPAEEWLEAHLSHKAKVRLNEAKVLMWEALHRESVDEEKDAWNRTVPTQLWEIVEVSKAMTRAFDVILELDAEIVRLREFYDVKTAFDHESCNICSAEGVVMVNGVTICSLRQLSEVIATEHPDEVVSAVPLLHAPVGRWHGVFIDDIYNVQLAAYKQALRDVLAIDRLQTVVVHCEHGKSRSAALALALVYQRDPEGVAQFLDAHPEAEPNPLLLILADDMLGAGGDLWRRCAGRYKGNQL